MPTWINFLRRQIFTISRASWGLLQKLIHANILKVTIREIHTKSLSKTLKFQVPHSKSSQKFLTYLQIIPQGQFFCI